MEIMNHAKFHVEVPHPSWKVYIFFLLKWSKDFLFTLYTFKYYTV